jgi:hypothetical protein
LQLFEATALHQRAVGQGVASLHILEENRGVGDHIQHRQQLRDGAYQLFETVGASGCLTLAKIRKYAVQHDRLPGCAFSRSRLHDARRTVEPGKTVPISSSMAAQTINRLRAGEFTVGPWMALQ